MYSDMPCGGYKVVYEYANRFSRLGYKTTVVYTDFLAPIYKWKLSVSRYTMFKMYIKRLLGYKQQNGWFKLDSKVREIVIPVIDKSNLPRADYYVATAIDTSYFLARISFSPKQKRFYLIQDFESWGTSDEYVYNSYKLPLNKIVISPWLYDKVESTESKAKLIPNGFDFNYFQLTTPIEQRNPHAVALLYHIDDRKCFQDAYTTLQKVKEKDPHLTVNMFGAYKCSIEFPKWITFYYRPDRKTHNMIYNSASIFIAASKAEGMALPPAEAMICGCALVCTDIGGFKVYAIPDKTALMSPVHDTDAMADNILKLINDSSLRIKIAHQGNDFIKQFTWEKAALSFEEYIKEC